MHILITSIIDLQATTYSRLHHFIEHFLSKGHKVTVISIRDPWKHAGKRQNQGLVKKINMRYITERSISPVFQKGMAFLSGRRILKGIKKVDVHLAYNSVVLSNIVSKSLRAPTVYDLADDIPDMIRTSPQIPSVLRPLAGMYSKSMLEKSLRSAGIVTITAKEFLKSMGIARYRHAYIPNGVDLRVFRPLRDRHSGIVIGYLGALREWVDLRPMLLAVKGLSGYRLKVLIVGGEEDLPQYREFVEKNSMKNVTFTGNVAYSEVPKYINRMDIATVPFRKNRVTNGTCPLKLLEYLACEKPAICTRLNETVTMLGDRVLYADTVKQWEKQISTLYHDGILRDNMGREGRKFVGQNFNWKKICNEMESILKEVIR